MAYLDNEERVDETVFKDTVWAFVSDKITFEPPETEPPTAPPTATETPPTDEAAAEKEGDYEEDYDYGKLINTVVLCKRHCTQSSLQKTKPSFVKNCVW